MVDGNRIETWINNKFVGDQKHKGKFSGSLMIKNQNESTVLKNIRYRKM